MSAEQTMKAVEITLLLMDCFTGILLFFACEVTLLFGKEIV